MFRLVHAYAEYAGFAKLKRIVKLDFECDICKRRITSHRDKDDWKRRVDKWKPYKSTLIFCCVKCRLSYHSISLDFLDWHPVNRRLPGEVP